MVPAEDTPGREGRPAANAGAVRTAQPVIVVLGDSQEAVNIPEAVLTNK